MLVFGVVTVGALGLVLLHTQNRPVLRLRGHQRMGSWLPQPILKIMQGPIKGTWSSWREGGLTQAPCLPSPPPPNSPGISLLLTVAGGEVRLRGHPASCLCTSGDNNTGLERQGPGLLPTIPMSRESCWAQRSDRVVA